MKTFAINIVTNTRAGDAFDAVAINKFPVIYTADSTDDLFDNTEFTDWVHSLLKAESLFEKAKAYVRSIDEDDEIENNIFDLPEKMTWEK